VKREAAAKQTGADSITRIDQTSHAELHRTATGARQ
jgi:hypothetical protein